jgi:hypothetical protein
MKATRVPMIRIGFALFACISFILSSSAHSFAQSYNAITQSMSGVQPYQAYDGSHENIDLATGDVNIQIPLISLPGRNGHGLDLGIEYDSKVYGLRGGVSPYGGPPVYWWQIGARYPQLSPSHVGWRLMLPFLESVDIVSGSYPNQISCAEYFVLTSADGSTHQFGNEDYCSRNGGLALHGFAYW